MRPTTPELISAIVESLEHQVAPNVQDKWAASALRSATQLLNHLALRSEREGRVLVEDNRDVREVLETVLQALAAHAELSDVRTAVEKALNDPEPSIHDVAALDARNEVYQAAVDRLLRQPEVRTLDGLHESLRSYLRRRLLREHPLYFPVFTGPPF
jgi:hypothetical protein